MTTKTRIDRQALTDRIQILQDAAIGAKIGTRAARRAIGGDDSFRAGIRFAQNMPRNQRELEALRRELTPLYALKAHLRGRLHAGPVTKVKTAEPGCFCGQCFTTVTTTLTPARSVFNNQILPLDEQPEDYQEAFARQAARVADLVEQFTVEFTTEEIDEPATVAA